MVKGLPHIFPILSVNDYGDDYGGQAGYAFSVIRSRRRSRQPSPPFSFIPILK